MSALRVNETMITAENVFNPDNLWMEGKHESKHKDKTFFLGIFADSWAVPQPFDRERRMSAFSKHYLVFAIFKPLSVSYRN